MQPDNLPPIQPPEPPRPSVPGIDEPLNQPEPTQQLLGYDATGQPLYGVPTAEMQQATQPAPAPSSDRPYPIRSVEAPRLVETNASAIRQPLVHEDAERLHAESVQKYPGLNLSEQEYVIARLTRSAIGFAAPLVGGIILICILLAAVFAYPMVQQALNLDINIGIVALIGIVLAGIVAGVTYMTIWVYRANQFFVTNESVIHEAQTSPFSHSEKTVSLGNIEDVGFATSGVLQSTFNYGTISLSIEGEDPYTLTYVAAPRDQAATLTNAVEDFKNGRAVDGR